MAETLDTRQLRQALEYMAHHNGHHIEELAQWAAKIQASGRADIAAELGAIIALSKEIGAKFETALKKL